jgi:hypothetical protein
LVDSLFVSDLEEVILRARLAGGCRLASQKDNADDDHFPFKKDAHAVG